MKSIRHKIILLILCSVVISCSIIGTLGIFMTARVVNENANSNMNLLCKVNADKLELAISSVEDSVGMLAHYAEEELGSVEQFKDKAFRDEYTENLERNALHHIEQARGALAIYVRYDYDLIGENDGFFYVLDEETGNFKQETPTDLSAYSADDIEHVGWWHLPAEHGRPVWLDTYYNANIDHHMFSYVYPFYSEETLVGVVGIDISTDYVAEIVKEISVYKTGKAAIIESDGTVIYHPDVELGEKIEDHYPEFVEVVEKLRNTDQTTELISYSIGGVNKELAGCRLSNDMIIVCFAPESEIFQRTNILITQIVIMIVIVTGFFCAFSVSLGRKITRPIKMLNNAAKNFIEGDTDIVITENLNDEIGELARTLGEARNVLRFRMEHLEAEAHKDGLTGAGNKFAFFEKETEINRLIEGNNANFAIAVFDVNNLKIANDNFGHMAGDDLLATIYAHLARYYGEEDVFRIGGDEFVVTVVGEKTIDFEHRTKACNSTMKEISVANYPDMKVGCACGIAFYDSEIDYIFSDVLRRADREMYIDKEKEKSAGILI